MFFVRACSFKAIRCDVRTDGHDAHYECWTHIGSKKARAAREPPPFLLLRPRPAPTTQRHHRRHIAITTNTASSQPFFLPTSCLTPTTHLVSPTLSASLPTATISSDVPPAAHPSSPFPRSLTPRPPFGLFPTAVLLHKNLFTHRACALASFSSPRSLTPTHHRSTPYPQPSSVHSTYAQLSRATSTPSLRLLLCIHVRPVALLIQRARARFTQLRAPSSLTRAPPAPPPPPPPSIRLRSVTRLRFTCNAQRPTHPAIAPVFRVGARVARVVG